MSRNEINCSVLRESEKRVLMVKTKIMVTNCASTNKLGERVGERKQIYLPVFFVTQEIWRIIARLSSVIQAGREELMPFRRGGCRGRNYTRCSYMAKPRAYIRYNLEYTIVPRETQQI